MFFYKENEVKAASYSRLSREDGDKMESDSIRNQKDLIADYAAQRGIRIVSEYTDDGYSGTNFDRPNFQRMMEDVKKKKINCIIVKDLSRLGRNYIETGRYLEKIFPFLGVRFIAINDHYDSVDESGDADQIVIPFKNLINDAYCRDISIKIRSQLDVKRKNGKFIGSFAAYGYLKDPNDKNHLIIDEAAAEIVRTIFGLKLNGFSAQRISERLEEMQVAPPLEYKRMCGFNFNSGFRSGRKPKWSIVTVNRILRNELYIGTMVQGKNRKINYKVKQSRPVDEASWITHQFPEFAYVKRCKSCTAGNKDRLCRFARRKLVFLILSYGKMVRFVRFKLFKEQIYGVLKFLVVLSCLGRIDKFKQSGKVLFLLGCFIPNVADQRTIV